MKLRTRSLAVAVCLGLCTVLVGCGDDGHSGGTSQRPPGKPCGPYGVELDPTVGDVVVNYLWSDGQPAKDSVFLGQYGSGPVLTGWSAELLGDSVGLPGETHTLRFENVSYDPISFTLTIDGQHTCTMP